MKNLVLLFLFMTLQIYGHAQAPQEIPLWSNGAPGFEDRKDEPTQAKDWWIKNIHNPTITAYLPPAGMANGTAVLIFPGGGHRELVYEAEGGDAARFFNSIGVTAFALKYRLAREEGSPYDLNIHPKQDAERAMRLIRSKAAAFNINPDQLGIMGFSAGGEVATMIAYGDGNGSSTATDPIDQLNAKPNFQILIYPGPLGIPDVVPADAPPAFILAAIDDPCCSGPSLKLIQGYHTAKIAAEAHIYSKGSHGFNMGKRSDMVTLNTWPQRMADWMKDTGLLEVTK